MMRAAALLPDVRDPVQREVDDLVIKEARRRARIRRRRLGVVAVVVAVAALTGYWALNRSAPSTNANASGAVALRPAPPGGSGSPPCLPAGQTPPVPQSRWDGVGFLSDEPVSAAASTPGGAACTLVLRYGFHRFGAGISGMVFLYSDGRLIVDTATGQDWFVQWEHRLTPAGVERLRTAVVRMLVESPTRTAPGSAVQQIRFRDGVISPKDPFALVRLLVDRSWLSEAEWVTQSPSVYRAAWYLVCYGSSPSHGADVRAAVRDLPAGARDVLEARGWTPLPQDVDGREARHQCVVLSHGHAAILVKALGGDITVGTADAFMSGERGNPGPFSVHALMPDGTAGAHGD